MTEPTERPWFAAFLDVRGRLAVVVGGGAVGAGKAETLLRAGALVTVVAPAACEPLARRAREGTVTYRAKRFEPGDLAGASLALAATDDAAVNAAVAAAAGALDIPVNVADDPSLSTFIMPALVDRGPVQVAVSTGGASPVVATRIAGRVEAAVPPGFGRLAALAREFRAAAKARFPSVDERRAFWEHVVDGPIGRLVLEGREAEARAMIESELRAPPAR